MSMEETVDEVFLGTMDIQEAKTHQIALKNKGVKLEIKSNGETCTTGCKVTVEVWGKSVDSESIVNYFRQFNLKNIAGHTLNFEALASVYDTNAAETMCQACGAKFATTCTECPDCGLCYG